MVVSYITILSLLPSQLVIIPLRLAENDVCGKHLIVSEIPSGSDLDMRVTLLSLVLKLVKSG